MILLISSLYCIFLKGISFVLSYARSDFTIPEADWRRSDSYRCYSSVLEASAD